MAAARFLPAESSENDKAPNLRVMASNVEIGAAWQRTSKDNSVYHSVQRGDGGIKWTFGKNRGL